MAKVRIHELAKELGVPSMHVLDWLNKHGEFIKSASSVVAPTVGDRVRAAFADGAPGQPESPPLRPGMTPPGLGQIGSLGRDPRWEAAEMFGVDRNSLRLRGERPRGNRPGAGQRRTVDRQAAANALIPFDMSEMELTFFQRLPHIERSELDWLVLRWETYNFTPVEVAAWLDAGARPVDHWTAARLRDAKVPPKVALMHAAKKGRETSKTFFDLVSNGNMPAEAVYRLAVKAGKIDPEASAL